VQNCAVFCSDRLDHRSSASPIGEVPLRRSRGGVVEFGALATAETKRLAQKSFVHPFLIYPIEV
jgi:hypothetical protein